MIRSFRVYSIGQANSIWWIQLLSTFKISVLSPACASLIGRILSYSFFDEIKRIGAGSYVPSEADVLHARTKTTGISETKFKSGTLSIHMFDVGGQRSERKKWWVSAFESQNIINQDERNLNHSSFPQDPLLRICHINHLLCCSVRIRSSAAGRVESKPNERIARFVRKCHQFSMVSREWTLGFSDYSLLILNPAIHHSVPRSFSSSTRLISSKRNSPKYL